MFVKYLTKDLLTLTAFHRQQNWNYAKFQNCVKEIKQKFDSISYKAMEPLPEKLWRYFYATVVIPLRDQEFGEFLEKSRKAAERQRQEQWAWTYAGTERQDQGETFKDDYFDFLFRAFFKSSFTDFIKKTVTVDRVPAAELERFGLSDPATEQEIKKAYRSLCMTHHPDRGGTSAQFMEITDAKDRLLSYYGRIA